MEENKGQTSEDTQNSVENTDEEILDSENIEMSGNDDLWKDAQEAAQEIEGSKSAKTQPSEKASKTENASPDINSAKLALLKNELEAKDNQLKRMAADFDNYRRRQAIEREELLKSGGKDFIIDFLPVLDNFDRAIASSKDAKDISSVISGIEMIQKQLLDSVIKNGVQVIECIDTIFDPNYHEAVQQIVDDTKPDQTVLHELQKGYTLNGKVIRPSMVVVSTVST